MEKYFKLCDDDKKNWFGRILSRIECIKDLPERGVKAGELGGYVEKEENIQGKAWVYDDAMVYDNAVVKDNAEIHDHSRANWETVISGNAKIFGESFVAQNALVTENAVLKESATAAGNSVIKGNAILKDHVRVIKNSEISGNVTVDGDLVITGEKISKKCQICCLNLGYPIVITAKTMSINTVFAEIEDWFNLDRKNFKKFIEKEGLGDEVEEDWWFSWKDIIRQIIEKMPVNNDFELIEKNFVYAKVSPEEIKSWFSL